MTLIHVPKPPDSAMNPDRPVSSLLKTQIEHLHKAEKRLPRHHLTEIYVNAIKTEGEAAAYIRAVTESIHNAHAEAAAQRARPRRKRTIEIAAVADDGVPGRVKSKSGAKKSSRKQPGKK